MAPRRESSKLAIHKVLYQKIGTVFSRLWTRRRIVASRSARRRDPVVAALLKPLACRCCRTGLISRYVLLTRDSKPQCHVVVVGQQCDMSIERGEGGREVPATAPVKCRSSAGMHFPAQLNSVPKSLGPFDRLAPSSCVFTMLPSTVKLCLAGYTVRGCCSKSILKCSDPAERSSILISFPLLCVSWYLSCLRVAISDPVEQGVLYERQRQGGVNEGESCDVNQLEFGVCSAWMCMLNR